MSADQERAKLLERAETLSIVKDRARLKELIAQHFHFQDLTYQIEPSVIPEIQAMYKQQVTIGKMQLIAGDRTIPATREEIQASVLEVRRIFEAETFLWNLLRLADALPQ